MGVRVPKRQAHDLLSHSEDRALDLDHEAGNPRTELTPWMRRLAPPWARALPLSLRFRELRQHTSSLRHLSF